MATATITLTDNEEDGTVSVNIDFGDNGVQETAAHAAAITGMEAALKWLKGGDSDG